MDKPKKKPKNTSGPPKTRAERRAEGMIAIEVWVTSDMRDRLDESAAVAGVPRAEWIRKVLQDRLDV